MHLTYVPSSDTPAFSHFWIKPEHSRIGHPMLDEFHGPFVAQLIEEAQNVRIEHPVHSLPTDTHMQRIERLMRVASRTKPIRVTPKVHLVAVHRPSEYKLYGMASPDMLRGGCGCADR